MENLQAVSDFLAMVSNPEVYQAKIKELQNAKAQLDKAMADKFKSDSADVYVARVMAEVDAMLQGAQDKMDAAQATVQKAEDYKVTALAAAADSFSKSATKLAEVALREAAVKAKEEEIQPALNDIDLMTQRLNARRTDLDAREAALAAKAAKLQALLS